MGRADVRARRHRGHVRGDREDEARRGGAGACRPDEDRDRGLGRNHVRDDRARGVQEATGRAQGEHHQPCAGAVCPIHRVNHVFRRDRMNDAVNLGGVHSWRAGTREGRLSRLRGYQP